MKTVVISKSYSWVEWPVYLRNCPGVHVTCKFFGNAKIDPKSVEKKFEYIRADLWKPSDFTWEAQSFGEREEIPVLEFITAPREMHLAHSFFDLIKDQFEPWRPHITVPTSYWLRVQDEDLTPQSEAIMFGEPHLYIGNGL